MLLYIRRSAVADVLIPRNVHCDSGYVRRSNHLRGASNERRFLLLHCQRVHPLPHEMGRSGFTHR